MNTAMIYILIMNVIGFCLMGLDKHRARTQQWRVPVCTCSITRRATGIL